jgi:hypothetical protein
LRRAAAPRVASRVDFFMIMTSKPRRAVE